MKTLAFEHFLLSAGMWANHGADGVRQYKAANYRKAETAKEAAGKKILGQIS